MTDMSKIKVRTFELTLSVDTSMMPERHDASDAVMDLLAAVDWDSVPWVFSVDGIEPTRDHTWADDAPRPRP
jgi:hypothetical protein